LESGMSRMQAALRGVREVGFTVVSMSISLIAVFIPILLMGGVVGRLFREFAVTLSVAVLVSLVVSLATTPMMCARLLTQDAGRRANLIARGLERLFDWQIAGYGRTLKTTLDHPLFTLLLLAAACVLNVYLYVIVPKGFFPQQDTGRLVGGIQA